MNRRAFLGRCLRTSAALAGPARLFANIGSPAETPRVREFERRIFDRINEVRVHCGSPPLEWVEAIWIEASLQSARKAILKFPGHLDPERGDVEQRLRSRGLAPSHCGENLFSEKGYDDPVNLAIVCWWYSAGHRENLLNPDFTQSAVGVAIDPDHRIFATQIFVTTRDRIAGTYGDHRVIAGPNVRTQKSPADRNRRAHKPELIEKLFGRG